MTQATGAQALARTAAISGERRYAASARAAYRALTRPVPRGAAVMGDDGRIAHFAMYSFRPQMRVLNGEEQSLIGVADFARITGDRVAAGIARRGARELATRLPAFDTGAWTLYDLGGAEADLNYHRLAARFAKGVCTRALARGFCPAAARFARYTVEPPKLALLAPTRIRAPRRVTIALGASKRADAHLVVRDRRGRVVADRRLVLDRTIVRLVLPVRRPGTYAVALSATAVNGRAAQRAVDLRRDPAAAEAQAEAQGRAEARAPRRRRHEAGQEERGRSGLGEAHEARVVALGRRVAVRLVLRARLRVGGGAELGPRLELGLLLGVGRAQRVADGLGEDRVRGPAQVGLEVAAQDVAQERAQVAGQLADQQVDRRVDGEPADHRTARARRCARRAG